MISFVSSNSPVIWQTNYSQGQSPALTNNSEAGVKPDDGVKKDPVVEPDISKSTENKKSGELSEADLKIINELKQRDAEVRAHEAAHLAAAGSIATGGASFQYRQGPDGIQYAVGGEVNIDTSPVPGDPAATLRKADTIRRAAMAPAEPSGPDLQVAASAAALAAQAQIELFLKNQNTQNGDQDQLGTVVDLAA